MKHLVYIFPSNFSHGGLKGKALGQIEALRTQFNVTPLIFHHNPKEKFDTILAYIRFNLLAICQAIIHPIIYYRYNPKFPLITLCLCLLSYIKPTNIEHNARYETELKHLNRPIEALCHAIVTVFLKRSQAKHLLVQKNMIKDLIKSGFNGHNLAYLQNGIPPIPKKLPENPPQILKALRLIENEKKSGKKVGIFLCSGRQWSGIKECISLFKNRQNASLIIIGPHQKPTSFNTKNIYFLGPIEHQYLAAILQASDFGIGPLNTKLINTLDGSPLRVRDYLANGLPVLINYTDHAASFKEIKPYLFNLNTQSNALDDLLNTPSNKEIIKTHARRLLSWKNTLLPIIKTE